ncbi:DUF1788 domain-containing protein [Methylobacterium oxalidis]|uniref:DUF1788 domain-containing protein n=1 Tax=Methylobacterium oxalidis TaxID=944322 RepID=UPI003314910F
MKNLDKRLGQILERITSREFLSGRGLGNDIPYHVFDYPPSAELRVREHVDFLVDKIGSSFPDLTVGRIDLLQLIRSMLEQRNLLDRTFAMQKLKGDEVTARNLSAVLEANKVAEALVRSVDLRTCSLVLIEGVGAAFPLVRTHNLLNALHSRTGGVPIVVFYPGRYDGSSLRLCGEVSESVNSPYYRAFRLVDDSDSD